MTLLNLEFITPGSTKVEIIRVRQETQTLKEIKTITKDGISNSFDISQNTIGKNTQKSSKKFNLKFFKEQYPNILDTNKHKN